MTEIETERAAIAAFSSAFQYDMSYVEHLLDVAPGAYLAFKNAQGMGAYEKELPLEARHVARIAAMLADDCGACAQLGLRMAVASGVSRALLTDLLDAPEKLPADLADVRAHAISVVEDDVDPERVARLRARYGEAGLAEMAVCIAGGRIYPSLKRALGREGLCSRPSLEF